MATLSAMKEASVAPPPGRDQPVPRLTMSGVGKVFGAFTALANIDIAFHAGEVHCLLGENGAGKSTLCNIIYGLHSPSSGAMVCDGVSYAPANPKAALASGVAMVHQHFSLIPELSVLDNLLMGQRFGRLDRRGEAARIVTLAETYGLSLDPHALVADLSVGQRQRVEIVKCLMHNPKILILDEPTAVLLPDEITALLEICRRVADSGSAVVMVTHKLAEIEAIADRVTVLHRGIVAARSDRPAADMDGLVRAMIQRPDATGDDPAGLAQLSTRRHRPSGKAADEVAQLDGISLRDELGIARLQDVTLSIARGEIVGIAGVEGNGQTELGNMLAGLLHASDGRWFVEGQDLSKASPRQITEAGVGIVPEDRHRVGAVDRLSLADNIFLNRMPHYSRFGIIDRRRQVAAASTLAQQFDVRAAGMGVRFGSLSGGNQQKAVLARELTTPNLRFLLAAQPTRGLDVGAVKAVYSLIRDAADTGVGVLLISSELDELLAVADRIVVLYRGQIVGECTTDASNREQIGIWMSGKHT
ncbi:ABC transporter ATP-binding protein [Devosia ureilytica]|uniref:ABC transporter ATP-binding protein n=1 Tax=Devosia ureilytica TaxID=2952754 RepID=A0A9Q4AR17_9HYPH|nr:ABC transporter ATP-binding protein [Devosia ureilytica]MCP8888314.1 ABC transporter ATP-binding protein [Devosia ureilytica]